MQSEVITAFEQVTSAWLTEVLSRSGALETGAVQDFDSDTGRGTWSAHARLRLRYADGSQGPLPDKLFLKLVNTDLGKSSQRLRGDLLHP